MVTFIIIVILYFAIGWIRLSLEIHGNPTERTTLVMQEKYLQYVLIWPLPLLFNSIGSRMIEREKQRYYAREKPAPTLNQLRPSIDLTEPFTIIFALYMISTKKGLTEISVKESLKLELVAARYDLGIDIKAYESLLKQENVVPGMISTLDKMTRVNKEQFCIDCHKILSAADQQDSIKQGIAYTILDRIGISENERQIVMEGSNKRQDAWAKRFKR